MYKIICSFFILSLLLLTSCKNKRADKLIGEWKYEEAWSVGSNAIYPKKDDPEYEESNKTFREALSTIHWFFGKEIAGTITTEGDTLKVFNYHLQHDSILVGDHQMQYVRFDDDNELVLISGEEYTRLSRVK